ncbi:MAG: CFI-box-CTERM domain-containing protein [Nitrosopumilaceae archaeon]
MINFFQKLQTNQKNVNMIRVWAFERFEGLRFDNDCYVTGVDAEFLYNLSMIFEMAKSFGIKVYLCLLDSWSIYDDPPLDIIQNGKQEYYLQLQNTWKKIVRMLVKDSVARQKFFDSAIHTLLGKSSLNQNLFAIDIMNEPEGLIQKDPEINLTDVKNFIKESANYIHSVNSSIMVSCGFQRFSTVNDIAKEIVNDLNFFDFHEYNHDGNVFDNSITLTTAKPCIIGECGYPVGDSNDSIKVPFVIEKFFKNANSKGFAGCTTWLEDYNNKDEILKKVKDFADKNPIIMEAKKQGCFIATAAMGSELHPHVQLLREYRDSFILKSEYKEPFLRILDIYYSFSPAIADLMEKNRFAKSLIKYLIVYPIVVSIKILIKLIGK